MNYKPNEVHIVIPSYNEGTRLQSVVRGIQAEGFNNIIVVDDGSDDDSINLIRDTNVIILSHLVNRGAGAATETGLKYCREFLQANTVVMMDADTQHDPQDIHKLLSAHFENHPDITIGNRFISDTGNVPTKNRLYNYLANIITTIFSGRVVHDSQSGFKVFNRRALYSIIVEHDTFEHCSEIFIKANELGLKILDVPIKVYYHEQIKDKGQHFAMGMRTFFNLFYSVIFKSNQK